MFPEQYHSWSLVSPFQAEKMLFTWSDYKTTALLAFSLSGPWPTFYFCHWNSFHQHRGKKYPHFILAVPHIFYDTLKIVARLQVSASATQFLEQHFSLGDSESLPCPFLTSSHLLHMHAQGETVLLSIQHWKDLSSKPIFIFSSCQYNCLLLFQTSFLDKHILPFFMN